MPTSSQVLDPTRVSLDDSRAHRQPDIEWTFATVRLRTRGAKGAGNRQAADAMACQLLDAARTGGGGSVHPSSCLWSQPEPA